MQDFLKVEERDGYLCCIAAPFDYSIENIQTFFNAVLKASADTDNNLVCIDFSAIRENTPVTMKTIAGFLAEKLLRNFQKAFNRIPRIALFGVPPHINSYRPAQKILEKAGLPFAVFTDEAAAIKWLFDYKRG